MAGDQVEFCECGGKCPGYLSLRDPLNTFVCGRCMKPSLLVWLASERFCEECDASIYTRWEIVCSSCQTVLLAWATDLARDGIPAEEWPPILTDVKSFGVWLGWEVARERAQATWPWEWNSTKAQEILSSL